MVRITHCFLFLSLVISFSCSNEDDITGSGNIVFEDRELSSFQKISNSSSINLVIKQGASQSVRVTADDNIIGLVKTNVENGMLKVDLPRGNYNDITILITINLPIIDGIENSGSGNITISEFEQLRNLKITNQGSGSITANGSGAVLDLTNTGSGSYFGFDFIIQDVEVRNTGSGSCEIFCSGTLNGSNSGSGSIFYKGNPELNISNTGTGVVSSMD
ncbi:MAG: head GIN domain-containing protein [Croceivirga sp.]